MNVIKRLLLAPVPWLEKHAIYDGEFSPLWRRLGKVMMVTSIVILAADPMLSMIRFGYPGFSHPLYYATMVGLIATIYLVMRPGSETSLLEMKRSRNWIVKGSFYLMRGIVLVLDWIIERHPNLSEFHSECDDDESFYGPEIGDDGLALSNSERMNMYMNDMAAPPRGPI